MPDGGSSIFTDADGYQSNLQDILDLLVLRPRHFRARLTWADLPNLQLLRARESSARVGYMRLPGDRVFVTFPVRQDSVLVYGSVTLRFGNIMLHSRGEQRHQRTLGACEWASVAVSPDALLAFGRTLADADLAAPQSGQVLRPREADGRRLLRLHARVGDVVEKNLDRIANREVVRALEQDLIGALIACLADGKAEIHSTNSLAKPAILPSFEALLMMPPCKLLRSHDISDRLGISEATLKARCLLELGMGPGRYQRLRRLKLTRTELLRSSKVRKLDVETIITRYGFRSLDRFVMEYWRFYGEMPPVPPFDPSEK